MNENDPVDDSEFVYRRIHPDFYDSQMPVPIQPRAFRPSRSDDTGLSVLRASFAQPEDLLKKVDPATAGRYAVARLSVRDLKNLGLTVTPEPIAGGVPGHAVIPELRWSAYHADKVRWKPVLVELAKLASADIVLRPANP